MEEMFWEIIVSFFEFKDIIFMICDTFFLSYRELKPQACKSNVQVYVFTFFSLVTNKLLELILEKSIRYS